MVTEKEESAAGEPKGFVAVSTSKELHHNPTIEACNVDDARAAGHAKNVTRREYDLLRSEGWDTCAHCKGAFGFPDDEVPV